MGTLHRIVLTGGPCGGKTTALARISERLGNLGYRVVYVPEVATLVFGGGIDLSRSNTKQFFAVQSAMTRLQLALEEQFFAAATADPDVSTVLLFDRGTMDGKAYMTGGMWAALLHSDNLNEVALRDARYDAVIHLVTAAEGAEQFYTLANNEVRTETPDQARRLDARLQEVWTGHPHLRVIDNSTDFEGKIRRTLQAICRVVGIPEPLEVERKYLVSRVDAFPVYSHTVEIEQIYLSDGSRIRRRGNEGHFTYTHTVKRPRPDGPGRFETEDRLTAWEYVELQAQADPKRHPVRKRRTCFLWNGHYFELDDFSEPDIGKRLLEVELDTDDAEIVLPPFIGIEREVTNDPAWTNSALALR